MNSVKQKSVYTFRFILLIYLLSLISIPELDFYIIPGRGINLQNLVYLFLIFNIIIDRIILNRSLFSNTKLNTLIFLYILIGFVACIRNYYTLPTSEANSILYSYFQLMKAPLTFYLVVYIIKDYKQLKIVTYLLILFLCILVLRFLLISRISGATDWMFSQKTLINSNLAVLDPNALGFLFVMAIMITLGLSFYTNTRIRFYLLLPITGLLLFSVLLTYSRGAIIALLVGLAFFVLRKRSKISLIILVVFIVGGVLSSEALLERFNDAFYFINQYFSSQHRLRDAGLSGRDIMAIDAINLILKKPIFGYGYQVTSVTGHTLFFITLLNTGLIGLIILIWMFYNAYKESLLLHGINERLLKGIGIGCAGMVVVVFFHGIGGWSIANGVALGIFFFTMLGIMVAAKQVFTKEKSHNLTR